MSSSRSRAGSIIDGNVTCLSLLIVIIFATAYDHNPPGNLVSAELCDHSMSSHPLNLFHNVHNLDFCSTFMNKFHNVDLCLGHILNFYS